MLVGAGWARMGIVVSTAKHEQMVAEKTNMLNDQKAKADRKREELAAYKAKSDEEEGALEKQLQELELQKAKLVEQQKTLQADYSEMESLRQEREAQVVNRCVLRIFQRALGVCFAEWKEFVVELVRERDRQMYSSKVEELALRNKHLKASVDEKLKDLAAVEEQTQKDKATQLIMRLKYKDVAICFNQWKGYVRANVEDRHRRNVEALKQKLVDMEADRDRLRVRLTDAEREGLKLAMAKFELEEKDLQKQSHIAELAGALTHARDTIERQVQQWPSSSKSMRRELKVLNSAYEEVARVSSTSGAAESSHSSAVPGQSQPQSATQRAGDSSKEAPETAAKPTAAESLRERTPSEVGAPAETKPEAAVAVTSDVKPAEETTAAAETTELLAKSASVESDATTATALAAASASEVAADAGADTEPTLVETPVAVVLEIAKTEQAEDGVRPAELVEQPVQ
eukprot:COSAG02_NODE_122_length_35306_cov_98.280967_25_plen_458_part_00